MTGLFRALRRRAVKARLVPPSWLKVIKKRVPYVALLNDQERRRFVEMLNVFLDEKTFIGARGFEVTEEVRVVLAAQALRLVLDLDLSYYDRLHEIVVYPTDYKRSKGPDDELEGSDAFCGEVDDWSVVVFSWQAVLKGLQDPSRGFNPGLHEFAHVLDRETGTFDGTPRLRRRGDYKPWAEVMSHHFLRLKKGAGRERSVLDDYGAENEAEFFAVVTEAFFGLPIKLREELPELYGVLKRFYGCDPVRFVPKAALHG